MTEEHDASCLVLSRMPMLICNACRVKAKLPSTSMMRRADHRSYPTAAFQESDVYVVVKIAYHKSSAKHNASSLLISSPKNVKRNTPGRSERRCHDLLLICSELEESIVSEKECSMPMRQDGVTSHLCSSFRIPRSSCVPR